MSTVISQNIVGYSVVKPGDAPALPVPAKLLDRDEVLTGSTYKIKTPLSEHALYVTINNMDGKPFELFISSKAMEHFQWIVALTRVISAVFRTGGNCNFLVEELKCVVDPKGGYFKKGRYMPSLVAEIGSVLETHLLDLGGLVRDDSLAVAAREMVAAKVKPSTTDSKQLCAKCLEESVVIMDGCAVCLSCGDSKCS